MATLAILLVPLAALLGSVLGSCLACIPGLHVYNVLGFLFAGLYTWADAGRYVPPYAVVPFVGGMMVGYAMLNTIPSVLLAAPDESALFTVLPGQKKVSQGRGYEAVLLTTCGGVAGLLCLILFIGPLAPRILPPVRRVLAGHTHWIIWCVICFMLMSEWPKGGNTGQAGWRRFADGLRSPTMGLLTFALSGLLGFVLLFRSPVPAVVSFQNLMPAFVGLFTLPWLLLNIATATQVPPQDCRTPFTLEGGVLARGALAGLLGGGFAAFMPVVSGGVGGLLAGHATAIRDDRVFLVSQGASKLVYYVGALLFFFVPGLGLTRGGGAWMMRGFYIPHTTSDYYMMLAAIALGGAAAVAMVDPLTRGTLRLVERFGYRRISGAALVLALVLVTTMTGIAGFWVMLVAGGIGLLPVLFGSRRMNCLGVILLPMACNMSGAGEYVAGWLGLM